MATERRMGAETSETRGVLLDVAMRLMLTEGYAAVGVRRVAREAGVTPALIHYYFRTLDDLFLEMLRRNAELNMAALRELATSQRPLHALWERGNDPASAAITTELLALANHRKAIRSELAEHAARFRQAEVEIISRALAGRSDVPAVAISAVIAMVSRTLVLEDQMGLALGHDEVVGLVREHLDALEPAPSS